VRDGDLVCRYGGEEFVVVFPDATASEVEPVVHRVVATLSESVRSGDVPAFTISVGMSDSGTASGHAEAIRQADEAMFRAKQAGRDRVVRTSAAPALHDVPVEAASDVESGRPSVRSVQPVAGT
jgi:diguanylate cyclase (GGDEF)-like protein